MIGLTDRSKTFRITFLTRVEWKRESKSSGKKGFSAGIFRAKGVKLNLGITLRTCTTIF